MVNIAEAEHTRYNSRVAIARSVGGGDMSIKPENTDPSAIRIGYAIVLCIIRYVALIVLAWLALKLADAWIMALIDIR